MPQRVKDAYKRPLAPRTTFKEYVEDPGPAGVFSPIVTNLERIIAFALDRVSRMLHRVEVVNEKPLRVLVENQIQPKMDVVITNVDFAEIADKTARTFQKTIDSSTKKLEAVMERVAAIEAPVIEAPEIQLIAPEIKPLTVEVTGVKELAKVLGTFQENLERSLGQSIEVSVTAPQTSPPVRSYVSGEVKKRDKYGNPTEIVETYSDGSTSTHKYSWKD